MKLNVTAIIERGFVTMEEYQTMGTTLQKIIFEGKNLIESIWICPLEDNETEGQRFHFVFCEEPVSLAGAPRGITGMVGIGTSRGPALRSKCTEKECRAMFAKVGPAAVRYMKKLAESDRTKKK